MLILAPNKISPWQGIEIDGPGGLSGPAPSLVEKSGSKFRVRTFEERGSDEELGSGLDDTRAPLIDVIHRLLWLLDHRSANVQEFLKATRPNQEQLRLVTQSLCAPILDRRPEAPDATPTAELRALSKLNANWRGVVEGAAFSQEVDLLVRRERDLFSGRNE